MELSIYDVIKRPIITSKSLETFKKLGKITFEVHKLANKITVRNAVEKIWHVEVASISMVTIPGKTKIFGRKEFHVSAGKKAIVTLKKGYKIEIPGMFESMGAPTETGSDKAKTIEKEGK